MPELPDKCVDLVFTDPPYNCGKDYGTDKDNRVEYEIFVAAVCSEIKRIGQTYCVVVPSRALGLWTYYLQGGWVVGLKGRGMNAIRRRWENKLVLLWTDVMPRKNTPNLWEDIRLRGEGYFFTENTYGHPGYTPINIAQRIIDLADPQIVIDPFMGTGTTARAAKNLGRDFVGFELDPGWCEIARKRLAQEVLL